MTLIWIAVLLGFAATFDDIRRRAIANWINAAGLSAGLIYHTSTRGLAGLGWSLGGAAIGFAVFLVFYVLGAMGGGDVKLSAAFGALLGPSGILIAALLAAPAGALLAAIWVIRNRRAHAIPYAPALTLGAWLAVLGRG